VSLLCRIFLFLVSSEIGAVHKAMHDSMIGCMLFISDSAVYHGTMPWARVAQMEYACNVKIMPVLWLQGCHSLRVREKKVKSVENSIRHVGGGKNIASLACRRRNVTQRIRAPTFFWTWIDHRTHLRHRYISSAHTLAHTTDAYEWAFGRTLAGYCDRLLGETGHSNAPCGTFTN